jgi:hypothetical protein
MIFDYLYLRGVYTMKFTKIILSIMILASLVFLIACQSAVEETVTEEPAATDDSAATDTASSEEAEIAETLDDFDELDSLEDDLSADFEELENIDLE